MISVQYPGKLFILGEYSIMEPGNSAIIVSVNRYLNASLKKSDNLLIMSDYGILNQENIMNNKDMKHVQMAYTLAKELIEYKGKEICPFELTITSQLNSKDNKKYGFGSSGVVIVAVLDIILKFHDIYLSKLELFKLAVVTQKRMGELSSGGDIAASIYQGLISYTRYNLDNVKSDVSCVYEDWDYLTIENMKNSYTIEVGWTQKSHDTNIALNSLKVLKETQNSFYRELLDEANNLVVNAIKEKDILPYISHYRNWMLKLSKALDYVIETPRLRDLIESANALGYVSKISGSGGGDCGIAVSLKNKNNKALKKVWEDHNIEIIQEAII